MIWRRSSYSEMGMLKASLNSLLVAMSHMRIPPDKGPIASMVGKSGQKEMQCNETASGNARLVTQLALLLAMFQIFTDLSALHVASSPGTSLVIASPATSWSWAAMVYSGFSCLMSIHMTVPEEVPARKLKGLVTSQITCSTSPPTAHDLLFLVLQSVRWQVLSKPPERSVVLSARCQLNVCTWNENLIVID